MKAEEWIPRLNAKAKKIDALCAGVHPSVLAYLTEKQRREWRALVAGHSDGRLTTGASAPFVKSLAHLAEW